MTTQITTTRTTRRTRLVMALVGLFAAAGLTMAAAPAAHAAGSVTINGSTPGTSIATFDTDQLVVDGSGFQANKAFAIAVCNTTLDAVGATRCNGAAGAWASGLTDGSGNISTQFIDIAGSFRDFNFQTGSTTTPANHTICSGFTGTPAGSPNSTGTCSLQIIQYTGSTPGIPAQTITIPLSF